MNSFILRRPEYFFPAIANNVMVIKTPCLLFLKIITWQEVLSAYCLSNKLTRIAYSCAYLVSVNPAEIKSL